MESRITLPIPDRSPAHVLSCARAVAFRPPKGFKTDQIIDLQYRIEMSRGMSLASWGEKITISVFSAPTGGSVLEIISRPAMPTTLIDYGRGDKNVAIIRDAIVAQLMAVS